MNLTMKNIVFLFLLFSGIYCYAQEPNNNLGKTLSLMKMEFPELRYIGTDEKGDQYEDGYPQDGIAIFFYFKNNLVVEECMICQSADNFPRYWYNEMVEAFNNRYYSKLIKNYSNSKTYGFRTFNVDIIFVSENGINTALIVYSDNKATKSSLPSPKTNLGKSFSQILSDFPGVKYTRSYDGKDIYKDNFHEFAFKYGKVVCDTYTTFGSKRMNEFMDTFSKTNYTSQSEISYNSLGYSKSYYYDNYTITVSYWQSDGMVLVTYQHKDYFK